MTSSNPSSTPAAAGAKTTELVVWNPVLKDSVGFNGEVVAWSQSFELYNLGYGQRVFSPRMRMFCQMDSLSPFGEGGANGYQYGRNNPIVYVDPTGHIGWQAGAYIFVAILGFLLALFSFGLGLVVSAGAFTAGAVWSLIGTVSTGVSAGLTIGSAVERDQGNIKLSDDLNFASILTGIAGSGVLGTPRLDAVVRLISFPMAIALTEPSAAAAAGDVSAARNVMKGTAQGGGEESSNATYMASVSGSVPQATAATGQSEASSSLSRLLDTLSQTGLSSSESVTAHHLHAQPGNPDRYATANRPPPSPYIRSTEQP